MNSAANQDYSANDRAYELHRMEVVRKLEDWSVYKKSEGAGPGGYPNLAQSSMIGRMVAEKATEKRNRKRAGYETIFTCDDCGTIHASVPRKTGCIKCGRMPGHKGSGFKMSKADSVSGKTVFASMISDTSWMRNFNAEIAMDRHIEKMPLKWQQVLYAKLVWYSTIEESAEKIGISVREIHTTMHTVVSFLVGIYHQEHAEKINK